MPLLYQGDAVCFFNQGLESPPRHRLVFVVRFLGIVTRGDQQVGEHQELVVCELLLVLLPVVMVSPPEVRQSLLHSHFNGLGVIEVSTQVH